MYIFNHELKDFLSVLCIVKDGIFPCIVDVLHNISRNFLAQCLKKIRKS